MQRTPSLCYSKNKPARTHTPPAPPKYVIKPWWEAQGISLTGLPPGGRTAARRRQPAAEATPPPHSQGGGEGGECGEGGLGSSQSLPMLMDSAAAIRQAARVRMRRVRSQQQQLHGLARPPPPELLPQLHLFDQIGRCSTPVEFQRGGLVLARLRPRPPRIKPAARAGAAAGQRPLPEIEMRSPETGAPPPEIDARVPAASAKLLCVPSFLAPAPPSSDGLPPIGAARTSLLGLPLDDQGRLIVPEMHTVQ